jgi:hypothetical protein
MRLPLIALLIFMLPVAVWATAPVGVWSHPAGDRIDLFDDQGKCPDKTKRANYFIAANGVDVPGCWMAREPLICMMFDDGDRGCMQSKEFKWQPGMAPAKLTRWM